MIDEGSIYRHTCLFSLLERVYSQRNRQANYRLSTFDSAVGLRRLELQPTAGCDYPHITSPPPSLLSASHLI